MAVCGRSLAEGFSEDAQDRCIDGKPDKIEGKARNDAESLGEPTNGSAQHAGIDTELGHSIGSMLDRVSHIAVVLDTSSGFQALQKLVGIPLVVPTLLHGLTPVGLGTSHLDVAMVRQAGCAGWRGEWLCAHC